LTRGKGVYSYNYDYVFNYLADKFKLKYEPGKRMWLEGNNELYKLITNKNYIGDNHLPIITDTSFKSRYFPNKKYVCFTLTTGDLYRNLSTNVWNGVFKKKY
jgi:hypothetical protein